MAQITPKLLNEKEAAVYIGMSLSFLRKARQEGDRKSRTPGPKFRRVGAQIRYHIDALDEWIAEQPEVAGSGIKWNAWNESGIGMEKGA
jgi:hypothetical protein